MTSRIEASRRHGPFDPRWSKRRLHLASARLAPAAAGLGGVPDGLDWAAFSTRYFRGRDRHDLEALSAYDAYKHGRRWPTSNRPSGPRKRPIGLNEPSSHGWKRRGSSATQRVALPGPASILE
jgi:hypothetical protein